MVLTAFCGAALALTTAAGPAARAQAPLPTLAEIRAACDGTNPYFAVSNHSHSPRGQVPIEERSIILFRDTPRDDASQQVGLASPSQVGTVLGLAYDAGRGHLYAAAFHKRATVLGPGGPGAVYRVDIASGAVVTLATLAAGPERHDYGTNEDEAAARWVGRSGLGGLAMDAQGDQLFVANLYDGRIHRFGLPDGRALGSLGHGASQADWSRNARLFGLAWQAGWLYHGVVDSRLVSGSPGALQALVYRSREDGSAMAEVARFGLDYPRDVPWTPWQDTVARGIDGYVQTEGFAWLTDLEPLADGRWAIGLRDRQVDMIPILARVGAVPGPGVGDLLIAEPEGDTWQVRPDPEPIADRGFYDESLFGGVADAPRSGELVASGYAANWPLDLGAFWFGRVTGQPTRGEVLDSVAGGHANDDASNGLGDVVRLCPPGGALDPAIAPTATAQVATATAGAPGTATARALATPVPTRDPRGTPTPDRRPTERFPRDIGRRIAEA